jgi:hypothetical protein
MMEKAALYSRQDLPYLYWTVCRNPVLRRTDFVMTSRIRLVTTKHPQIFLALPTRRIGPPTTDLSLPSQPLAASSRSSRFQIQAWEAPISTVSFFFHNDAPTFRCRGGDPSLLDILHLPRRYHSSACISIRSIYGCCVAGRDDAGSAVQSHELSVRAVQHRRRDHEL